MSELVSAGNILLCVMAQNPALETHTHQLPCVAEDVLGIGWRDDGGRRRAEQQRQGKLLTN